MSQSQGVSHSNNGYWRIFWLVMGLLAIVVFVEFLTPSKYVFGYLYIAPILLASRYLSRRTTFLVTLIACVLALLNIWPTLESIQASTITNRVIVTLALTLTGILSDRNRLYEQKVLQQQAKLEAHKKLVSVREDFASALTHDLKSPLIGAIETIKAFQNENFGPVQSRQNNVLTIMLRSHETTLQIIEMLLDVYRNDNEGLKLHLVPINLVDIVEEVTTTMTDLAATRQVVISQDYRASDVYPSAWVKCDTIQIKRVIANLLINAINHSPRGERVEVILETGSSYQTLKVTDHGAGIKADEFPYIFEQFFQGNSDRQAKGSGLGLYLSRQIVEAHGGTIWVENRQPTGASFAFRLPSFSDQSFRFA